MSRGICDFLREFIGYIGREARKHKQAMRNNELELWIETDTLPRYGENTARLMTGAGRTSGRKAANMKKSVTGLSTCPQCHEAKLPHRVCPNCGYYDGKDVVNAE